jgi:predicted SnoaL-like aldol condensation-catalyzing enzyme
MNNPANKSSPALRTGGAQSPPQTNPMRLILIAFLLSPCGACTSKQVQSNVTTVAATSTTKYNKELIKTVFTEMAGKQNYVLIDTFFSPDIYNHGAPEGQLQGREGFRKTVTEFLGMFSRVEIKVEELLADGDLVASRETWKVTMAATGKTRTGETMHMFRVKGGLITEEWSRGWEWLGL